MDDEFWSPELAREETVVVALRRFSRDKELALKKRTPHFYPLPGGERV